MYMLLYPEYTLLNHAEVSSDTDVHETQYEGRDSPKQNIVPCAV